MVIEVFPQINVTVTCRRFQRALEIPKDLHLKTVILSADFFMYALAAAVQYTL